MPFALPPRHRLAVTPTPFEFADRLSTAWAGPRIWIKRDDLTGFGLSGNKVRKLEFHFAAAIASGADTVVTCGAVQSNHCRATALAAARVGLRCILLLRKDQDAPAALTGNHLLDRLAGADIRFITPGDWAHRDSLMAEVADTEGLGGHSTWTIPEGASDALGMWGFVLALREVADQAAAIDGKTPVVWHASSSGGTTAGIGWATERLGLTYKIVACSVGDGSDELARKVQRIWASAAEQTGATVPGVEIEYNDAHIGAGYGLASTEDLAIQAEATALTGLIFDPTYTGKALAGLKREIDSGVYTCDDNIIFWHTGGGFAAFAHDFSRTAVAENLDVGTA